MYNAHWIHSLPYSKFIELTLFKRVFHHDRNKEVKMGYLIPATGLATILGISVYVTIVF